jgi:transcriptional regulator with XRE-family HTH domain
MNRLVLNYTELASRAKLSGGLTRQTVSAFMTGRTWPNATTLTKLDRALGWEPGTIGGIATGSITSPEPPKPESPPEQNLGIMIGWPDDFTDEERQEWEAAIRLTAAERTRTIRASRNN